MRIYTHEISELFPFFQSQKRQSGYQEPVTWKWIAPGEPVAIGNYLLKDGMVYVGRNLRAGGSYNTEPSLLNPNSRIAASYKTNVPLFDYWPTYASASPVGRRVYLEWLANGRRGELVANECLMLFFYGLERRLVEEREQEISSDEKSRLLAELYELRKTYPDVRQFQSHLQTLLQYLQLLDLLHSNALFPADRFWATDGKRVRALPPALELTLSRMAKKKMPLTADYAYAWYLNDPELMPRIALTRCPDEMRRLFAIRFMERFPKGIPLKTLSRSLSLYYYPANRSLGGIISPTVAPSAAPSQISISPLKNLREIGTRCSEELASYARRMKEDGGGQFLAIAALPAPLFTDHPGVARVGHWLAEHSVKDNPVAAADLLRTVRGIEDSKESIAAPGRAENMLILESVDRLGYAVEPDARWDAPLLLPEYRLRIAADPMPLDGDIKLRLQGYAPLVMMFAYLFLPKEPGSPHEIAQEQLLDLANELPRSIDENLRSRLKMRLQWLLENPPAVKMPRKITIEPTEKERHRLADLLTNAAVLSPEGITPAKTKDLSRLFKVIGVAEETLYSRLHHAAVSISSGVSDDLPIVKAGIRSDSGYRLPDKSSAPTRTKGDHRTAAPIDMERVRYKIAESAKVSALLADIFTETETAAVQSVGDTKSESPVLPLLRDLLGKETIRMTDFSVAARAVKMPAQGAYEIINEMAFEAAGDAALEGDDPIYVNGDIVEALLHSLER